MKTIIITLVSLSLILSACKKDDEGTATDYRDRFTGIYVCKDSSATYHPTWTGDSITGIKIDTIIVQTMNVSIEKMTTTDSSISIFGEEFWVSKSGACTRSFHNGPLGIDYQYEVSITNGNLDYRLTVTPFDLGYLSFRRFTGRRKS